jgi:signal recognition particle GTPase
MNKALHEGLIQKNLNLGKQGTGIDIQNQMNRIRTQLLENDIPLKYVDRFIKLIGTVTPF